MIISDGTTDLTFLGTQTKDFTDIEQSSSRTTSGSTRTVRAGRRFSVTERIRITGTEWKSLSDLLMNNATDYYYTPTRTPDYLTSADFPMQVKIDIPRNTGFDGGGTKRYYVTLKIEGADYL
jgi:hypothetical protein